MKKFFNEFSKVIVIVFVTVCVYCIVCDTIQMFIAIKFGRDEPGHALALMAFGTGLMSIYGYGVKSFKQKDSLNKNGLRVDSSGKVSRIDDIKQ